MTSTAVQNLVEIRPWGASGQIGEILTIFRFFFIPFFKQCTCRSDRSAHHIFTLNGSYDAESRKGVPFLALVDIVAHLGDQVAPKNKFLGRE